MRRIIAYIYHYKRENNILHKCSNKGFCRVELDSESCKVTLCLKDGCGVEGAAHIHGLKIVGASNSEKNGKYQESVYEKNNIEKSCMVCGGILNIRLVVDGFDGICVECGGRIYVALWKDNIESIRIVDRNEDVTDKDVDKIKEYNKDKPMIEKTVERQKIPREYMEYTRIYNRLCKIRIILSGKEYPAVKLKPYELMLLPRSCWRMANNVFLMESYYRHGHILFMEYEGEYVLAVPWKIDKKMEQQAERFGFARCLVGYMYGREQDKKYYFLKKL